MRMPARAAARARGHLKTPRFQSVEELLGLASLLALFVLLALEPGRGPAAGGAAGPAAARPVSVAVLPTPALASSPSAHEPVRHD